ncbi:hypothetical protein JTE90_009115 [Oedothorax gibbosus]|uniref:Uncharacterized protein n=1 Tax=Oedothorax gibbosus TaxID=931172 RepID=A0AAV6TM62_9ARAC|nr:hypothetical protein JTE90_009115 [Oedothorax gibbosus]
MFRRLGSPVVETLSEDEDDPYGETSVKPSAIRANLFGSPSSARDTRQPQEALLVPSRPPCGRRPAGQPLPK